MWIRRGYWKLHKEPEHEGLDLSSIWEYHTLIKRHSTKDQTGTGKGKIGGSNDTTITHHSFALGHTCLKPLVKGDNGKLAGIEGLSKDFPFLHKEMLCMSYWIKNATRGHEDFATTMCPKGNAEKQKLKYKVPYKVWPSVSLPPCLSVLLTVVMCL